VAPWRATRLQRAASRAPRVPSSRSVGARGEARGAAAPRWGTPTPRRCRCSGTAIGNRAARGAPDPAARRGAPERPVRGAVPRTDVEASAVAAVSRGSGSDPGVITCAPAFGAGPAGGCRPVRSRTRVVTDAPGGRGARMGVRGAYLPARTSPPRASSVLGQAGVGRGTPPTPGAERVLRPGPRDDRAAAGADRGCAVRRVTSSDTGASRAVLRSGPRRSPTLRTRQASPAVARPSCWTGRRGPRHRRGSPRYPSGSCRCHRRCRPRLVRHRSRPL